MGIQSIALAALVLILSSCGGGDDSGTGETTVDSVAPIISALTTTVAATTASIQFDSNEAGTAYYIVQQGGSVPTVEQVKNATGNGGTIADSGSLTIRVGSNTGNLVNLTAETTYMLYVMGEDSAGNQSTVGSIEITTALIDTTPPILSALSATVTGTTATLKFSSDETGTAYFLAQIGGSEPTAEQVKTGSGNGGTVSSTGSSAVSVGVNTVNLTGLEAITAHTLYLMVEDAVGNQSTVSSIGITTALIVEQHWITGQGPFGGLINSMVIDSQGRLFVATGDSGCNGYSCGRNGIFRSTDAGVTWSAANEGLTNVHVNSLAINSVDEIFSGTYFGGVFKSIDGGNNWNRVSTGLPSSAIVDAIAIDSTDTVFAGLRSGEIFRSNDGGANWEESFSGGGGSIISIFADSNDTIFMGTLSGAYESRDSGITWTRISEFGYAIVSSFMQTQSGELLSGTTHGVFRSTNGGLSWSLSAAGLPELFPRGITIIQASNGELVAGTQEYGFYRSVDGGINWVVTGIDSPRLKIVELQRSPSDELFAATDGGVLHSIDNGAIWSYRNEGLANSIVKATIVSTDGLVYAGSGAGVARSTDLGLTWSSVSQGLPRASGVSALIELPSGDLLAGTESTEVYKSIDNGASWQPLGNLPAATGSVTAIGWNSQGTLFLTTSYGINATGAYRSTDGGGTWIAINNGIQDKDLKSLAVDAHDTLFAAGKGIYRSLDGGDSWQLVYNSDTKIVWDFALTSDAVLAATTGGVVQTTDGGASWSAVSGASRSWIQSMAISDTGDAYLGYFNLQPTSPSVGQYRYESGVLIPVDDLYADDVRLTPLSLAIGPDGRVYAGLSGGGVAVR